MSTCTCIEENDASPTTSAVVHCEVHGSIRVVPTCTCIETQALHEATTSVGECDIHKEGAIPRDRSNAMTLLSELEIDHLGFYLQRIGHEADMGTWSDQEARYVRASLREMRWAEAMLDRLGSLTLAELRTVERKIRQLPPGCFLYAGCDAKEDYLDAQDFCSRLRARMRTRPSA